jgi:hypothetical protein
MHRVVGENAFCFVAPQVGGMPSAVDPRVRAAIAAELESLGLATFFPLAGAVTGRMDKTIEALARDAFTGGK